MWRRLSCWFFGYRTYAEYLDSRRWRKLRAQAIERDGGACRLCARRWPLQVHHRRYAARWGQESVDDLTTLCADCHADVTGMLAERARIA